MRKYINHVNSKGHILKVNIICTN